MYYEEKIAMINRENIQTGGLVEFHDDYDISSLLNGNEKQNSEYSKKHSSGPFGVNDITERAGGIIIATLTSPTGKVFQIALWRLRKCS